MILGLDPEHKIDSAWWHRGPFSNKNPPQKNLGLGFVGVSGKVCGHKPAKMEEADSTKTLQEDVEREEGNMKQRDPLQTNATTRDELVQEGYLKEVQIGAFGFKLDFPPTAMRLSKELQDVVCTCCVVVYMFLINKQ